MPAAEGGFAQRPAPIAADADWLSPFDWYREMRDQAPVHYDPDRRVWDVFRYDDVKRVLQDAEAFSSQFDRARVVAEAQEEARAQAHARAVEAGEVSPGADPSRPGAVTESGVDNDPTEGDRQEFRTMINTDSPDHERLRGVVDEYFRPRSLASLRPNIEAIAEELLTELPDGAVDIVEEFAYPLPVLVICDVLGVPREDRAQVRAWSNLAVSTPPGPDASEDERVADAEAREAAFEEMHDYFESLLAARQRVPRGDLVSTIAAAEADGTLSSQEAVSSCVLLLVAGNVTTINLVANALWTLEEVDLLDGVRDGTVPVAGAVEEVLRYRSPVQTFFRVAAHDLTLGGESIREGDLLMTWIGSANHDERQFTDPETFDPTRRPNPHLAFGQGRHFCLGAPLARLEADVALTALLKTFERITVDISDIEPVQSPVLYGVERLPVTLRRRRAAPV
jgi:cytochrome P450